MKQYLPFFCVLLSFFVLGCGKRDYTKNSSKMIELPQTLQDEELGFQFKYPADWNPVGPWGVEGKTEGNYTPRFGIFAPRYSRRQGDTAPPKLPDIDFAKDIMDGITENKGNARAEKGTLAGRECIKCRGNNDEDVYIQYQIIHRDRFFTITALTNPDNEKKDHEIFNAILSTMILTDD